ncbi:hypothetical protein ACPOM7_29055 [Peribacillus castrilensis]|uniref:Uncharacterized protein n=1 Tax=Peribacillus simplex TaxID=1478 RepID=A0AAN2TT01_9BACI|nr:MULTISPECIES: hypothetical protein [Bacillaceae]MCF7624698.1 hypothetical protein [Peribacillus frigoritolerans]MCP1096659.1 hypothetical protein [Bacillaceae bacterium OS4b]MEA3577802.1 hypothetical protein [Peribacillus frigoritolerans]CEG32501.1 hypothetical protein BN1180_02662 [Peribacillus simplex]
MYYYLLMLVIIVISIGLFWLAGLPKIKTKNLSFIMIGLGFNGFTIPVSSFIGIMAAGAPNSTIFDFLRGLIFIQVIPFLILMIGVLKWFKNSINNA